MSICFQLPLWHNYAFNPTQPNCPLVVHVLFWNSSYFREAWPSKWLVHVMWKIESFVCFYFVGERLVWNQCKVHLVTHFQEYFLLELLHSSHTKPVFLQNQVMFTCSKNYALGQKGYLTSCLLHHLSIIFWNLNLNELVWHVLLAQVWKWPQLWKKTKS